MKFFLSLIVFTISSLAFSYDYRDYSFQSYEEQLIGTRRYHKVLNEVYTLNDIIIFKQYDTIERKIIKKSFPIRDIIHEYFDKQSSAFVDIENSYLEQIKQRYNSHIKQHKELIENKDLNPNIIQKKCNLYTDLYKDYFLNKNYLSNFLKSTIEFQTLTFLFSQSQMMICENMINIFKAQKEEKSFYELNLRCDRNLDIVTQLSTSKIDEYITKLLFLSKQQEDLSDKHFYQYKKLILDMVSRTLKTVYDLNKACLYHKIIKRTFELEDYRFTIPIEFHELNQLDQNFTPSVVNPLKY